MGDMGLVDAALPLLVTRVEVDDPSVSIGGHEWFLSLLCPWILEGPGVIFDTESESMPLDQAAGVLRGLYLDRVDSDGDILDNPVFHFTGGFKLSVYADTDLDPWVLQVTGAVLVGRMPSTD